MSERDQYLWAYWNFRERGFEHPEHDEWDLSEKVRKSLRLKVQKDGMPSNIEMWSPQLVSAKGHVSQHECDHGQLQVHGHSEVHFDDRVTWDQCARCGAIVNQPFSHLGTT